MNIVENSSAWRTPITVMTMQQYFNDIQQAEIYKDKKVVVSEDKSHLFSVVGHKKHVVPHTEIVEMFYKAAESAFGTEIKVDIQSVKRGAGIRAQLNFPDVEPINLGKTESGDDDLCWLRTYLFNSYDGSTGSLRMKMGAFRNVCDNSMVIGGKDFTLGAKHLGELGDAEALGSRMKILYNRTLSIADVWKVWRQIELSQHQAMQALHNKLPKKFLPILEEETNFPRNLWNLYNDLTAVSTHKTRTDHSTISYDNKIETLFYSKNGPIYPLYREFYETNITPQLEIEREQETA